jgi:hypothetical protein
MKTEKEYKEKLRLWLVLHGISIAEFNLRRQNGGLCSYCNNYHGGRCPMSSQRKRVIALVDDNMLTDVKIWPAWSWPPEEGEGWSCVEWIKNPKKKK